MKELYLPIPRGELCVHLDFGPAIVIESSLDHSDGVPIRHYVLLIERPDNGTSVCFATDMDVKPY